MNIYVTLLKIELVFFILILKSYLLWSPMLLGWGWTTLPQSHMGRFLVQLMNYDLHYSQFSWKKVLNFSLLFQTFITAFLCWLGINSKSGIWNTDDCSWLFRVKWQEKLFLTRIPSAVMVFPVALTIGQTSIFSLEVIFWIGCHEYMTYLRLNLLCRFFWIYFYKVAHIASWCSI